MLLQSNSGIPVRVSAQFVPLTSQLKQTLNLLAGEEIYKISSRSHGQISWTPDVKKVTAPAKPRGLVHLRKNDVIRPIRPSSYIHYVGIESLTQGELMTKWYAKELIPMYPIPKVRPPQHPLRGRKFAARVIAPAAPRPWQR